MKNLFCLMFLLPLLDACGPSEEVRVVKKPRKPPTSNISWEEIKPLVDDKCNQCHGKSIGATFVKENFGPKAQARIKNNTMPPGGGLDDATKTKLLSY